MWSEKKWRSSRLPCVSPKTYAGDSKLNARFPFKASTSLSREIQDIISKLATPKILRVFAPQRLPKDSNDPSR